MKHLTEAELFGLADGGVPPNREERLRAHLEGCSDCRRELDDHRRIAADLAFVPVLDEEAHVKGVMARLEEHRAPLPAARGRWRSPALAAAVLAAIVLIAVGFRYGGERVEEREFAARGVSAPSLERDVGIRILTGTRALDPVADGRVLMRDAAFTAAYRSLRRARALVFAVDSASTVHWLFPAYDNADEDPESILLEPTNVERPFPTSVILGAPAPGALRIVCVVTEQALHVSDIERRPPDLLRRQALERDFQAKVTETRVELLP